jgi:hypothetical protein
MDTIMKSMQLTLVAVILIGGIIPARADTFTDSFANGINPAFWHVPTNASRFSVLATNDAVSIDSVAGTSNQFLGDGLWSTLTAYGNFDASIDFTNAKLTWLTGSPGNQAQLNCYFGDFGTTTNFFVVRSDEPETGGDQNAHVWIGGFVDQGGYRLGAAFPTTASFGTLRVTRTNSQVSGYLNSVLIAQATNYNTGPARFLIVLQNNGTHDAISITYDHFQLTADRITVGPLLTIQYLPTSRVALSWPTWGTTWTTNYALEFATNLFAATQWQTVTNVPTTNGDSYHVTNTLNSSAGFYRLQAP